MTFVISTAYLWVTKYNIILPANYSPVNPVLQFSTTKSRFIIIL